MWVWPSLGFAWGLALAIIVGPFLAIFGLIAVYILTQEEHRAETLIGAALGVAAGLALFATLGGIGQTPHLRLGP